MNRDNRHCVINFNTCNKEKYTFVFLAILAPCIASILNGMFLDENFQIPPSGKIFNAKDHPPIGFRKIFVKICRLSLVVLSDFCTMYSWYP